MLDLSNFAHHIQPHFKNLFRTDKEGYKIWLLSGGRSSGKTTAICQKLIHDSFVTDDVFLVVRATFRAHEGSTYQAIRSNIERLGLSDLFEFKRSPLEIINKITGCKFIFRGLVGAGAGNIRGLENVSRLWIEEGQNGVTVQDIRDIMLTMRNTKLKKKILISFNKTNPYKCIYKEMIEDPDKFKVNVNHSTYEDNIYSTKDTISDMELLKEINYKAYLVDGLGNYGVFEDTCLDPELLSYITKEEFDRINTQGFYQGIGLDWGKTHPLTTSVVYYDEFNNNLYVRESFGESGLSVRQFAENHLTKYDKYNYIPNKFADAADPQGGMIELRSHGWDFKPTYKRDMELIFIDFFNNLNNCFVVGDNCQGFIENVHSWQYKNGVPDKVDEDYVDSVRYGLEPIMKKLINANDDIKVFKHKLFNQY